MLFTIAIPTYNNAKTVSKAIESAINQDYKDEYEVLIVNNASTDNTAEVLSQYKENTIVRVETNAKTVDLFENHNVCFEKAKGDYVLFIHSDDELYPFALTVLEERIRQRHYPPRYILWGHSMLYDFQEYIRIGNQQVNTVFSGANAIASFLVGGLTPSGTCYSKKSILEIGGFPSMKSRATPNDWFILIWAAFNCFEFEMMDRMIYKRFLSGTASMVSTKKNEDIANLEMFSILFEKLNDFQKKKLLKIIYKRGRLQLVLLLKDYYSNAQIFKLRLKTRLHSLFFI